MASPSIWLSAGEFSGDVHGSRLAAALLRQQPAMRLMGMGGDSMREAGVETLFHINELSVMGFTEVLGQLPRILRLLKNIEEVLKREKTSALVVIDAPSFHFRVIKIAEKLGIPVYYYISPKAWAWRKSRAKFIKEHVRKLISILPFEVDFYRQFDMEIDYVGNPLIEIVNYSSIKDIEPEEHHIGFLPGSRKKEITTLMPAFSGAAEIMHKANPQFRFSCFMAPNMEESFLRSHWLSSAPLDIFVPENRWAAMRQCELLIAASGTVTLESAIAGVPTIAAYKVSPLTYGLAKHVLTIPYISLANLILNEEIVPECIQGACDPAPLAQKALDILNPVNKVHNRQKTLAKFDILRKLLGEPGVVDRAAQCIYEDMATLGIKGIE